MNEDKEFHLRILDELCNLGCDMGHVNKHHIIYYPIKVSFPGNRFTLSFPKNNIDNEIICRFEINEIDKKFLYKNVDKFKKKEFTYQVSYQGLKEIKTSFTYEISYPDLKEILFSVKK